MDTYECICCNAKFKSCRDIFKCVVLNYILYCKSRNMYTCAKYTQLTYLANTRIRDFNIDWSTTDSELLIDSTSERIKLPLTSNFKEFINNPLTESFNLFCMCEFFNFLKKHYPNINIFSKHQLNSMDNCMKSTG